MLERRIGLNTYNISTHRGPIKAAHSIELKHCLAHLTDAHVELNYIDDKLSAKDDAQEDNYLFNPILRQRHKPGSHNPDEIEFPVWWGKLSNHPK